MQQPDIIDLMLSPLPPTRFRTGNGPLNWRKKVQNVVTRVRLATLGEGDDPVELDSQTAHLMLLIASGDEHEAVHDATRIFRDENPRTPEMGQQVGSTFADLAEDWWKTESHPNRNFVYSNKKKDKPRQVCDITLAFVLLLSRTGYRHCTIKLASGACLDSGQYPRRYATALPSMWCSATVLEKEARDIHRMVPGLCH